MKQYVPNVLKYLSYNYVIRDFKRQTNHFFKYLISQKVEIF